MKSRTVFGTSSLSLAVALAIGTFAGAANAQDRYPTKAISLIVPFGPGGSTDVLACLLAKTFSDSMGQAVVVDYKPGAGGSIGMNIVSRAAPDGYTLLLGVSSMTTNAALSPDPAADPNKGLTPVAKVAAAPMLIIVNNQVPARSPAELVEQLKSKPGQYNYATTGNGSASQFATELILGMAGTSAIHVPYRGAAQAIPDLISNRVQIFITTAPSVMGQVRGGQVRAVAVTTAKASTTAPDLLPMSSALPGYAYEAWWGLFAPPATPAPIVNRLADEVNKFSRLPAVKEICVREGVECPESSPTEFSALIAKEVTQFKTMARERNIKAD